jgi:LysR family transcriptional regulator, transcriptional activator of the cysJI operon
MTFRHFGIFITVCETGSMTKASLRLAISQPSVSQAVKELEEGYGTDLFERLGKRLVLTEAGELCLGYARQILKTRDDLADSLREKRLTGPIRVGATVTIGTYLLPRISRFSTRLLYPVVENTARIEKLLLEGSLDIGLVEGETSSPALVRKPFFKDRLVIVCSPENPICKGKPSSRDIKGRGFYIRETGSGSRELFAFAMKRKGLPYRIVGELNNTEALKNFARADKENFSVISALAVDDSIRVIDIPGLDLERNFDIVHHRDKAMNEALREFMADLDEIASRPGKRSGNSQKLHWSTANSLP